VEPGVGDTDEVVPLRVPLRLAQAVAVQGDPNAPVVLAGHSHNVALLRAAEAGDGPTPIAVCWHINYAETPAELFWDFLVEHAAGRTIVVCFRGNETFSYLMFQTDPPMRMAGVSEPGDAADPGVWIPRSMYRALLARYSLEPLVAGLQRLVPAAKQVLVVGTPQPKPDAHVRNSFVAEPYFRDLLQEIGETPESIELTPERERVEHWNINQSLYAEAAATVGIPFIHSPPEAADADGMLLPEYGDWDVGHGSVAYGAMMWRLIYPYMQPSGE
jgi:hypothetical protein